MMANRKSSTLQSLLDMYVVDKYMQKKKVFSKVRSHHGSVSTSIAQSRWLSCLSFSNSLNLHCGFSYSLHCGFLEFTLCFFLEFASAVIFRICTVIFRVFTVVS